MKAVISNRIYLEVTPEYKEFLSKELTYKVPAPKPNAPPMIIKNMARIRSNLVSIPIGRIDLIPKDYEIIDKRLFVPVDFPEFKYELRASQQAVYEALDDNAIINAWVSWGKAQPFYSKIKTPKGWTTMQDIRVGDVIITPSNEESTVLNKYYHKSKDIYRITTSDGRTVDACADHLWNIYIRDSKIQKTKTTLELLELLKEGRVVNLPLTKPIYDKDENTFIIHPYVLGMLLGDGSISHNSIGISTADDFIVDKVNSLLPEGHSLKYKSKYDYGLTSDYTPGTARKNEILLELRRLSLLGTKSDTKFIPEEYKNTTLENKLYLIQGLLDADGSVEISGGSSEFSSISRKLIEDFCEIIYSLGGCANIQTRQTYYTYKGERKQGKISYRVRPSRLPLELKKQLFSLPRKVDRIKAGKLDNSNRVKIASIEYLNKQDCACIEIDSKEKLYLTDNCLVTHNTFTGLAIAGKLKQKTLVVVHNTGLRDQWVAETEKVYGFTPGIIGSGKFNIDTPIVVGNTQSLYRRIPEIQKVFGTILLDEMHHVSSPTFSRIVDTSYARYKIGLSGTIERKDGKHVVFRDYFGSNIFKPPKENFLVPSIDIVRAPIRFIDGASIPWANRVTALANNEEYRHLVAMLASAYAAKGHKVLVVSDRVYFLKSCAELVGDSAICVTGEDKGADRQKLLSSILSGEKNILFGTQAIFSEGISVNNLSCLILGTPVNNEPLLTQLIGRVIREYDRKLSPKIVDIHLKGNTATRQASNRMGYYIQQGYDIRELTKNTS